MKVYFDNSATTKPYDEVIDVLGEAMRKYYGNPSSAHKLGLISEMKINECREKIAHTLNCSSDEIIFTSGGSESNNFFIKGFINKNSHVIVSKIEHPSIISLCKEIEKQGVSITYLNVDSCGKIDIEELISSINKNTVLVSIMHVNNEIGTVQDIENIGRLIKEKSSRIKFHVDAVQSYGKLKIDVKKCKIDMLSASSHKIHGPRGIGFAYIRKGLNPKPLIIGGSQEKSFRAGTQNVPGIAGFTKAAEIMNKNIDGNYKRVYELKEYFIKKLLCFEDIKINSENNDNFSPYILSVSFKGIKGEVLLHSLEENGIYVSTGSACSSKYKKESSVLKAIGLSSDFINGTIRFSFCEYNTEEEVDYIVDNLSKHLKFLRRLRI